MRILGISFISLIVLALLAVTVWFSTREVLTFLAAQEVKDSLNQLVSLSRTTSNYTTECKQKGVPQGTVPIEKLQLRFTSATEYVTEALCSGFPLEPVQISQKTLPMFVKKISGSSGVILGDQASYVLFDVLGRKSSIGIEKQAIFTSLYRPVVNMGISPVSTCEGYGYQCCEAETQQPAGQKNEQVTDCPRTCAERCVDLPVVLSFASDPFVDPQSRSVAIQSDDSVTFSYVVAPGQEKKLSVLLEYGDGTQDKFTTTTAQSSHVYSCKTKSCAYKARVSVVDAQGLKSVDTAITTLSVLVNQ